MTDRGRTMTHTGITASLSWAEWSIMLCRFNFKRAKGGFTVPRQNEMSVARRPADPINLSTSRADFELRRVRGFEEHVMVVVALRNDQVVA
jgi:hypothetical protein